jgi:site-specific recombinase XerD
MRLLADFSTWLEQQSLALTEINEQRVEHFLRVRYQRYRPTRNDRAIFKQLLEQLRAAGRIGAPITGIDNPERQLIEDQFEHHLRHQRGLAEATVHGYQTTVRRFLDTCFGNQAPRLESLSADDVTRFMLQQTRTYSAAHAQLVATALRRFLRFLFQQGTLSIDLAQGIPVSARRRLSTLPRFMAAADVERLLQSIDQSNVKGRRDYAILMLLARLGLRAGEVAALSLDDLDWDAGALTVRGKRGQRERLPLPSDVGEALVNYLRDGRPSGTPRQVFLCLRAPRRGFAHGGAVSTIVGRALSRAGLDPAFKGAHLLRHSLATRMLAQGASLVEIGELLRHRHLDTTQIYAKVDEQTLHSLAPPWPGETR